MKHHISELRMKYLIQGDPSQVFKKLKQLQKEGLQKNSRLESNWLLNWVYSKKENTFGEGSF